jgi:hypothetical protein
VDLLEGCIDRVEAMLDMVETLTDVSFEAVEPLIDSREALVHP